MTETTDPLQARFVGLGRFVVRFRWLVLIAWLAATALAIGFFPSLASVTKSNNADFLPANSPSMQAAQLAAPFQAAALTPVPVVVVRTAGTLTAADVPTVSRLVGNLRAVPHVVAVKDLGRSPDGAAEQVVVLADIPRGGDTATLALVTDLRTAITGAALPTGLQAHLAGAVATQVDSSSKSGAQGGAIDLISIAFILVLLLAVFRSVLAPLVTLLPAALVVQLAGPVIAESTKAGLKVSLLSQFMLIVLILGAGTDYGLFLVFRVREEIRGGLAPRDAVVKSLGRVGESITFSAGTVIAALLSLLLATFGIYQSLGAPLAIGIAIMLLAGLTLLPALLSILGRAVFWPSRTGRGPARTGLWGRVATRIVQRPALTLVIGLVVFGGLAVASLGNRPAGFGSSSAAPDGTDSAAGNATLSAHFPKAAANPTNLLFRLPESVWSRPEVLTTAQGQLGGDPAFNQVTGPLNPNGAPISVGQLTGLRSRLGPAQLLPPTPAAGSSEPPALYAAYRATANYISPDGRTVQYEASLTAGDPSTTAALHAVPAIRAATTRTAHAIGATASGVAGEAPAIYDISNLSNHDLVKVVPVAILVIGVLLALVMRSLVAPLYLIVSVALSYLAALGLAVIAFIYIGGSGGLTFILPFLMFLFLLALGEDYNILVMTRIREEAQDLPLRTAVARALAATGTTVTSAGLVLAGTFAVFAIVAGSQGGSSQIRDVGVGLTLGILMDTFLVRTLLVPSTVVLLGRWNWWPSAMWRRSDGAAPGPPELRPATVAQD